MCSKKAGIFEVASQLPVNCKRQIGMSKTKTLLNASGINLCVLNKVLNLAALDHAVPCTSSAYDPIY